MNPKWEEKNLILTMGQQVIRILRRIHRNGFVHCDIKPFNILYDKSQPEDKQFTLIDFGISRRYVDSQGKHICKQKLLDFCGSVEFVATECLQKYRKLSD